MHPSNAEKNFFLLLIFFYNVEKQIMRKNNVFRIIYEHVNHGYVFLIWYKNYLLDSIYNIHHAFNVIFYFKKEKANIFFSFTFQSG